MIKLNSRTITEAEQEIFEGKLFAPGTPELKAIKLKTHDLNIEYNKLSESETEKRAAILDQILGGIGEGVFIQGPITFHYGVHTTIGDSTFINFNFTVQDDAPVSIGSNCNIGPNVTIVTPVHPMLPNERKQVWDKDGNIKHVCWAKPVNIGNDCWIGANVVICPGVTVGNNVVLGAGSVVTRDIPDNSFAAGVPCRVIREITEQDSLACNPELLGDYSVTAPEV